MTHKNMPHEPIGEFDGYVSQFNCSCDEVFSGLGSTLADARRLRDEAYAEHLKAKSAHRDTLRNGDVE